MLTPAPQILTVSVRIWFCAVS